MSAPIIRGIIRSLCLLQVAGNLATLVAGAIDGELVASSFIDQAPTEGRAGVVDDGPVGVTGGDCRDLGCGRKR